MSGNEIHCDCAIAWMLDFKPLQDATNGPVVCSSPSAFNGTLLSQVGVTALGCSKSIHGDLVSGSYLVICGSYPPG